MSRITFPPRYNYEEELEKNNLVFVYGTLKRAYGNSRLFHQLGGEFKQVDQTSTDFILMGQGVPQALPMEVVDEQLVGEDMAGYGLEGYMDSVSLPVRGEVWEINTPSCFAALDRLESEGSWYMRSEQALESGLTAWMYKVPDINLLFYSNFSTQNEGAWVWP